MLRKLPMKGASIGLGDRIGLATEGHIKAVKDAKLFPVFAQQSIRELSFTGRSFKEVINDVMKAIKRTKYDSSFGFDGDHLKSESDIEEALEAGITILTLDCSDEINKTSGLEEALIREFSGRSFRINRVNIHYTEEETLKVAKTYAGVIEKTLKVWEKISHLQNRLSLELSIDETPFPTHPKAHFLIGKSLLSRGVRIDTLAPRFPGTFEKGVDFKGNIKEFEKALAIHHQIASFFGYRLSIHSGSDKFSIFPSIGRITKGNFHIKTSGTSYLQAIKLVGIKDKKLFNKIWETSIERLNEARRFYSLSADPQNILEHKDPLDLFENENARQILHVSYMFVLKPESEIREKFIGLLRRYESEYHNLVAEHIEKHLRALGLSAGR